MSLELIDIIFLDWENPEYEGLHYDPNNINVVKYKIEDYVNEKIVKDIEQTRFIKTTRKTISEFGNDIGDLIEYYKEYNMIIGGNKDLMYVYKIESSLMVDEIAIINKYLNKNMNNILQIGFGAGIQAIDFLNKTNAEVLSFDLYDKVYSFYGNRFVEEKFPNRHYLIVGPYDMMVSTLLLGKRNRIYFDLIWFDENKDFFKMYNALIALRMYADSNTILLLNNICPHLESGLEIYMVMNRLIYENVLIFVKHFKTNQEYTNGIAVLKFNFSDNKTPTKLTNKQYKDMEINIPLKEFKYYLTNNKDDSHFDKQIIQTYIKKFKQQNIILDDETIKYLKNIFGIVL